MLLDIKRKAPFFLSDFTDAIHIQALSAILFIYLGTVTNAITFGGLLGDATENMQVRGVRSMLPDVPQVAPPTTTQDSLVLSASTCRVCWRVSWAQPSPAGSSACWPASRSPSSAALVRFWSLNGCSSTSAGGPRQDASFNQDKTLPIFPIGLVSSFGRGLVLISAFILKEPLLPIVVQLPFPLCKRQINVKFK